MAAILILRCLGGLASAFVIVCASTLVIDRLAAARRPQLAAVHFAGVGAGIFISAVVVAAGVASSARWSSLWLASGAVAAILSTGAAMLLWNVRDGSVQSAQAARDPVATVPTPVAMIAAYGLFGFGYIITTTFLVTIVRQTPDIRPLEPWIWMLVGLAAVPSVPLWQRAGQKLGLMRAFALAAVIEAIGVAASVEWVTPVGACVAAVLLGGTFMGLTSLGLMSGRVLGGARPQRLIGLMTASFGVGQTLGPLAGGLIAEQTGDLRAASLLAAAALMVAAVLALLSQAQSPGFSRE